MTTILKAGGSSVADEAKIQRILEQAQGLDDTSVLIVSAQGKTTDRIVNAIENARNGNDVPEPEEIFKEFEHLGIGTSEPGIRGLRDAVYGEFDGIRLKNQKKVERLEDPAYTAALHLFGERLAAAAVYRLAKGYSMKPLWLDFNDGFPMAVKGNDYHGSRIELDESRKRAQRLLSSVKAGIIVLPGYGGVDVKTGQLKTLGRGGSDTVAFGNLYAFQGGALYILTDVYGILNSLAEGGKTVPVLDLDEAKDAAALGAKLPGIRALQGLERYYAEGAKPAVYIAHSQDINGPKTEIVRETKDKVPVKLVAGRSVTVYKMTGDIRGLQDALTNSGVDWFGLLRDDFARIAVSQQTDAYAERLLKRYLQESKGRRFNGVEISKEDDMASVGVVGSGMRDLSGVAGRASTALGKSGINIKYNMDSGDVSLCFITGGRSLSHSIEALHKEFLAPAYVA